MNIAIINKKIGVETSPTGFHAHYLGRHLNSVGCKVTFISETEEIDPIFSVLTVRKSYRGKHKLKRLISELRLSYDMSSLLKAGDYEYVIMLTDPPFLPLFYSILKVKTPAILWAMDVYPQAFSAAGLISSSGFINQIYSRLTARFKPSIVIALGKNQASYLSSLYPEAQMIVYPVGLIQEKHDRASVNNSPCWYQGENYIYLAYVGNLGEAHDPNVLINIARNLRTDMRLIIKTQLSESVLASIKKIEGVFFIEDRLTDHELSSIDVSISILRPSWTHISVPSKSLAALNFNHAILFCGNKESDAWCYISDCGWNVMNNEALLEWLENITISEVRQKQQNCIKAYSSAEEDLKKALSRLSQLLTS